MREYINREFKKVQGGRDDIGDPSRTREELEKDPGLYEKRLSAAARAGGPKNGGEDSFVVWAPEPKAAYMKAGKHASLLTRITQGRQKGGSSPFRRAPKPAPPRSTGQVIAGIIFRIIETGWWFVEPVFDPCSDVRKRWKQHRLTWQDISLFIGAAIFGVGMFLMAVVFARVLGMGLQLLRMFMGVFKLLF